MKLGDLFIKLGLKSQEFEQGINNAKGKLSIFSSSVKKIGGIIAGAFAFERITAFVNEIARLGGEVEGVRAAFERIGGAKHMDALKRATAGTVSELNLMKRAVMASNFDIPIENLASLLEFATKRAQETGQSVDYLVESIVLGIGRKSPLILDNLGISAVRLRQELKGAGVELNTVQEIAAAVGRIAAAEMAEAGGVIRTNAIAMQQLTASWQNFKKEIATNEGTLTGVSRVLNLISTALDQLEFSLQRMENQNWKDRLFQMFAAPLVPIREIFLWMKKVNNEVILSKLPGMYEGGESEGGPLQNKAAQTIGDLKNEIESLKKAQDELKVSDIEGAKALRDKIAEKEKLLESLISEAEKVKETETAWNGLNVSLEASNQALLTLHEQIGSLDDVLDRLGRSVKGFAPIDELTGQTKQMLGRFGFAPEKEDEFAANFTVDDNQSLKNFEQFKDEFAMLVTDFGIDVVGQFGDAMGQLISTGELPSNFGDSIIDALGRFVSTLGKMLITLGIGSEAFQGLLSSGFTNPAAAVAAIAAGAALVAIGSGISSYARSKMGGGGGGGGTGMFNQSYNINVAAAGGNTAPVLFLKGDDIYWSQQRNDYKRGAIG